MTDDVLLDLPGNQTITYRQGTTEIRSLSSNNPFTLSGGTLTVTQTVQVNNTFTLAGGTLNDATVLSGTSGPNTKFTIPSSGTLTGVTLGADLTVQQGATLTVTNGLTLQGGAVVTLMEADGVTGTTTAYFNGTQTLGGSGQVVLQSNNFGYASQVAGNASGSVLTIGPGVTVRGAGQVGNGNLSILNQGTIAADGTNGSASSNKTLNVTPASLTNTGTLSASGGGAININNLAPNSGIIRADAGSTITISGTFTNTATGHVGIALGGSSAFQYGRITVSGAAALAGVLDLRLVNGFAPVADNTFQVLLYASRTGTFESVTGAMVGNGDVLNSQYNDTNLTLLTV